MASIVAIDTNVWVSAFFTPRGYPAQLKFYCQANRFDVVTSMPLLAELVDVLARPRLQTRYSYTSVEVATYVRLIAELADVVNVTGTLKLCCDPDDDVLLEMAMIGQQTI